MKRLTVIYGRSRKEESKEERKKEVQKKVRKNVKKKVRIFRNKYLVRVRGSSQK